MALVIGLLTFLLVLNSLVPILLILVQLPKKEAGAGLAFGGGASDALFGAGSGTVLSRITKYSCGLFLLVSLTLSVLYTHEAKSGRQDVLRELERQAGAAAAPAAVAPEAPAPMIQPVTTNLTLPVVPAAATDTPAPAAIAPNTAPPPPGPNLAVPVEPGR